MKGLDKLLEITAHGVGRIAGTFLAPWQAKQEGKAQIIAATAAARTLKIQAEAQTKARELLVADNSVVGGQIDLADRVNQRIIYQEQKRLENIRSVVNKAALELEDKEVPATASDHDLVARFFNEVQDVSSEGMQILWAKVLAGEVERPGSTSSRTLGILKDLDQTTANLFAKLCSVCVFVLPEAGRNMFDARVPSLGKNAGENSLADYGLAFRTLNRLNEHGLIISDYNSWMDFRMCVLHSSPGESEKRPPTIPFHHQDRQWVLVPESPRDPTNKIRINGVALSFAGRELSMIVERKPVPEYMERLKDFFLQKKLRMLQV